MSHFWKKCSACKKEIPFHATYKVCSVSTCNSKKLPLIFCSVECWDSHLGFANHKSSWAIEKRAPSQTEVENQESLKKTEPKKVIFTEKPKPVENKMSHTKIETDTLVVVSKVKKLIKDLSEMNTSQCAIDAFTQKVINEALRAIENAKAAGRKTVMGRDF